MRVIKNRWSILLIMTVLLLVWTAAAAALETRTGDIVNVPAGDIRGPLFVSGNNLSVDANVDGDVFAVGSSITINGNVTGDVIAAGNTILINGTVSGDIRTAGNNIDISGPVGGSITGAANSITLRDSAQVNRDVMMFGNSVTVRGPIQGQVMGSSNKFYLHGPVGGDVKIWDVQNLIIGPAADVKGTINYRSANPAQIDPAAQIAAISQSAPPVRPETKMPGQIPYGANWTGAIFMVISGFIIWGIFYLLFPQLFPGRSRRLRLLPGQIGVGIPDFAGGAHGSCHGTYHRGWITLALLLFIYILVLCGQDPGCRLPGPATGRTEWLEHQRCGNCILPRDTDNHGSHSPHTSGRFLHQPDHSLTGFGIGRYRHSQTAPAPNRLDRVGITS